MSNEYMLAVGKRLRKTRTDAGLSLHGVERKSAGIWKAVVVGSYERGERAITMVKLAALAEFYGVAILDLLPENPVTRYAQPELPLVLDLDRLAALPAPLAGPLARYAATITDQRGDFSRQVLSIRSADLSSLAVIYDMTPAALTHQLIHYGVLPVNTPVE